MNAFIKLSCNVAAILLLTGCPYRESKDSPAETYSSIAIPHPDINSVEYAIAAGTLRIKEYPPKPAPAWQFVGIELLQERYRIGYEYPRKPPDLTEEEFVESIRAWNKAMKAEIERRFGPGTLEKTFRDGHDLWSERQKNMVESMQE
ncbi:MAG TPA: hypothetical protein PKE55_07875 [Kiritimatiellia bacterium]|nr:hypothetical protein [Kiritimatiellia bacterium]